MKDFKMPVAIITFLAAQAGGMGLVFIRITE